MLEERLLTASPVIFSYSSMSLLEFLLDKFVHARGRGRVCLTLLQRNQGQIKKLSPRVDCRRGRIRRNDRQSLFRMQTDGSEISNKRNKKISKADVGIRMDDKWQAKFLFSLNKRCRLN